MKEGLRKKKTWLFFTVLFFLSPLHHLGHKASDGCSGLIRIQLGKQVADVVRCASLFPGHKPKQPGGGVKIYIYKVSVQVSNFLFICLFVVTILQMFLPFDLT